MVYGTGSIWAIFIIAGIGTFLLRLSFIFLIGKMDRVPPGMEKFLRLVPAAVLPALILPTIIHMDSSFAINMDNHKLFAGAVATLAAWRTGNMLATIAAGMVALWTLQVVL
ncbi:MAG: AzlD domain-containing protein [Desulfosalsimonas sp.]